MTRSERPSSNSGSRRATGLRAAAALAALGACLLAVVSSVRSQQVEDITGDIEKYRNLVALAVQKLDDLDLPEALARFTEVIDGYKSGKLPSGTPLTRQIVGQAYEGRARTYANLGRTAEAEADFDALIRYDVNWPIDRTRTSPKIVAMYVAVRGRVVGTLDVQTEPPGALITLNGESAGRSPVYSRELISGPYKLEVRADGYDPMEEKIEVAGGASLQKSFRLTPNARSIMVATSPAGAKVSLDGVERGATFGTATAEYADVAAKLGLGLADISAPLLVERLGPGAHTLRLEKECYEPLTLSISVALDTVANTPMRFEPIRLTPSLGGLSLGSTPAGAQAVLDGKPVGATPVKLDGICSGRHEVALRLDGVGQWIGQVEIRKGHRTAVDEKLRMTIAYTGMTASGPAGPAPGETELGLAIAKVARFNVLRPGAGIPEDLLARKALSSGDVTPEYLSSVAAATGADLVAVARPGEGAFERRADVTLYSSRYPALVDRIAVSLDGESGVKDLIASLSREPRLKAPWLGLRIIETRRTTNPVAVRVVPDGPASKAGVKPGEAVVSLGGKPVASAADLDRVVAGMKEGAQASLMLQGAGQAPRQVNVAIASTPLLVPPAKLDHLRSAFAAEMAYKARLESALGRPASPERNVALLNLGAILMEAGRLEEALKDAFNQVNLPAGGGISSGTSSYLRGLCLQRLGKLAEAREQLGQAARQTDATLWSNDGPAVADRARRLLGRL